REMFEEATFRIDHSFIKFLSDNVVYQHTPKTLQGMNLWMEQQSAMYADREHLFRETITRNRLQNVFLDIYDHVKREKRINDGEAPSRQEALFRKYIALVHDNFRTQHNVAFYAERMCITTRYLSAIVRNISGESPKAIIDRIIMLELKVLLRSTNMSIQEISGALHFPDQSYMGRYFRKHTGVSPSEYRQLK
ncbi:MAG: helix-turn-helix domain-containing protein, partial [Alistipes sp.]|nr:helix-turn-helix domain-containing protein [Alistipes sp.]